MLGRNFAHYEITGTLGAGGMGEVYRARDTRLNRDVALKVLPEAFAADPQRMARFEREAQVLASLNHPNIAAIYGLEESDSTRALVMELVEGQTLAERIAARSAQSRGVGAIHELLLQEPLQTAKQVAEALEYAHERGIIHRDLKPANIKITPEGTVKILDFGLAKAMGPDEASRDISNSPTLSAAMTQAGFILGTAAYMSPEQAKAKPVDRRCDIWAFGCVLFEILSGKKPFDGESVTDVLASVIKSEPDWNALPADTPPSIQHLIRRCLNKDPKQRLRDIGDARITIEETLSGTGVPPSNFGPLPQAGEGGPEGRVRVPHPRRILPWAVAALALIAGLGLGWWAKARRSPSAASWSAQMLGGPSVAIGPRISPDGHTLAFQAMVNNLTQVAVMDTDSGDWTVLTKDRTLGYVTELNWSNDGSQIYFDRDFSVPAGVYAVSRFGGDERLVLENAFGPEVLPDGSLLVTRVNQEDKWELYHFWPDSGRLEALDAYIGTDLDLCPPVRAFRDGKQVVFYGRTKEQPETDPSLHLYILDLASGKARRLTPYLDIHPAAGVNLLPIAVSSNDQAVLIDLKVGDLNRITSIPRNGKGPVRTLLTLTLPVWFMDVGKDGELYLDQVDRPEESVRFAASGGTVESLAGSQSPSYSVPETFQLPDGRVVFNSLIGGQSRLVVAKPAGETAPFIQTNEETSFPGCLVGKTEIAFVLGPPNRAVVALASIADGRIVRRLSGIPAAPGIGPHLAASPDGKTLYYAASGTVWAVPAEGGPAHRIGPGDSVAPEPDGKSLIVGVMGKEGGQLFRVSASGGKEQPIPFQSAMRVAPIDLLSPNAVAKDGRVLVSVASPDAWFYGAGFVDPRTGRLARIPLDFTGDLLAPGWLPDGRVLSTAWPLKTTIWRFRPEKSNSQ